MAKPNTEKQVNNIIGQFVGLAAVLAGIFVAITFGVLIFSPISTGVLVPIAWAFAVLGAILAFFMYKTAK